MNSHRDRPRIVGTGFIVLDVTLPEGPPRSAYPAWSGGTCGNVLSILGALGWRADAIGRIGCDGAGACLTRDLRDSGVDVSRLDAEETGGTAVILHRITRDSRGRPAHNFGWACPACDVRYPGYRPVLVARAAEIAPTLGRFDVFFFDRVSRGVLDLAHNAYASGALVMFEPSASTEPRAFVEAVSTSHIVKYAADRRAKLETCFDAVSAKDRPSLEIETLGARGLRFRVRGERRWTSRAAIAVEPMRDAAGAGDWLTSGLLHGLHAGGAKPETLDQSGIVENALDVGTGLAAFSCQFEGPRGALYAHEFEFDRSILASVDAATRRVLLAARKRPLLQMPIATICGACGASKNATRATAAPAST